MAKVKIKNPGAIERNLNRRIKEFKNDNKELQKAAKTIQNQMRISIRDGKQPDGEGFPSLSSDTLERRVALSANNKTSKFYGQQKSNATFTGDLVRKLFAIVKGNKIVLFGKGNHKKLKGIRVKTLAGSDAPISDIVLGFADRGVKLLGVTETAKIKIKNQFVKFLRRKRK